MGGCRLMLIQAKLANDSIVFSFDREMIVFKPTAYALANPPPGKAAWDTYAMNVRATPRGVFSHVGPNGKNIAAIQRARASSGYTLLKEVELLLKGPHRHKGALFNSIKGTIETCLRSPDVKVDRARQSTANQDNENLFDNVFKPILKDRGITRPKAIEVVRIMVLLGAVSRDGAKPEPMIMKQAGVRSRIVSVFSDRSGDAKNYAAFRERYIANTGERKALYYLKIPEE